MERITFKLTWIFQGSSYLSAYNWFGHIYGCMNFKIKNTSKTLFRFDFLMMDEGYHNNH
tara:strand:- start:1195 stop:1371 length:177 start_codon:yes stop_codon:yes gene_type:complete